LRTGKDRVRIARVKPEAAPLGPRRRAGPGRGMLWAMGRFCFISIGLVWLVAGLGAGCAHRAPELAVADVRVTEATGDGYVVSFFVDAVNPNEAALPLREVRYTVWLDDERVFSGVRSAEATLNRLGTQRIRLPAAVAGAGPPERGSWRIRGRLFYSTPGTLAEVLFDAGVIRPRVRFSDEGEGDFAGPG
jgi:hypothetical protein